MIAARPRVACGRMAQHSAGSKSCLQRDATYQYQCGHTLLAGMEPPPWLARSHNRREHGGLDARLLACNGRPAPAARSSCARPCMPLGTPAQHSAAGWDGPAYGKVPGNVDRCWTGKVALLVHAHMPVSSGATRQARLAVGCPCTLPCSCACKLVKAVEGAPSNLGAITQSF